MQFGVETTGGQRIAATAEDFCKLFNEHPEKGEEKSIPK